MVDICDLALVGSKLEQDGLVINLTREYFQQEVIESEHAGKLLKKCAIANLVGNSIVAQALEMGDEITRRLVAQYVARHCRIESISGRIDARGHCPDDCIEGIGRM